MKCILLRHGIAVSRDDWKGPDSERPLSKEGFHKTRQAIEGLRQIADRPTHLLSSPYRRALETAQLAEDIFELGEVMEVCPELVFTHSPNHVFPILSKYPETSCILCVGHEPHLSQLAAMMISGRFLPGLSLKKAGACTIGFVETPLIGHGCMEWWLTPAQLRQLGKK